LLERSSPAMTLLKVEKSMIIMLLLLTLSYFQEVTVGVLAIDLKLNIWIFRLADLMFSLLAHLELDAC
jgi:hypothetical protein